MALSNGSKLTEKVEIATLINLFWQIYPNR